MAHDGAHAVRRAPETWFLGHSLTSRTAGRLMRGVRPIRGAVAAPSEAGTTTSGSGPGRDPATLGFSPLVAAARRSLPSSPSTRVPRTGVSLRSADGAGGRRIEVRVAGGDSPSPQIPQPEPQPRWLDPLGQVSGKLGAAHRAAGSHRARGRASREPKPRFPLQGGAAGLMSAAPRRGQVRAPVAHRPGARVSASTHGCACFGRSSRPESRPARTTHLR